MTGAKTSFPGVFTFFPTTCNMSANSSALIFIPDISGYTNFVNETEIEHSRHILSELLEVIINSDQLGLTVSEVEGDAVLSYRFGPPPALGDLIGQCRKTFLEFHHHVRRYDSERICRCGACKTAVNLSLKFIVHYGKVERLKVKHHEKLHGMSIILAHRLLKNQIQESEYILLSDSFNANTGSDLKIVFPWFDPKKGTSEYDTIGKVEYQYIPLAPLHPYVREPDPVTIPGLGPDKVTLQASIKAGVDKIYENFTNFDKRVAWNEDIREIILKNERINKAGALHTCLVGSNELEIEAIGRMENKDRILYGERLDHFKGLKDIITIFTFEKGEDETTVTIDLDYRADSFLARLFKVPIRKMLIKQTEKSLRKLKLISEQA